MAAMVLADYYLLNKTPRMKLALHWKILIGMVLGLLFGLLMKNLQLVEIVSDWIKPFGTIFINLLKMVR